MTSMLPSDRVFKNRLRYVRRDFENLLDVYHDLSTDEQTRCIDEVNRIMDTLGSIRTELLWKKKNEFVILQTLILFLIGAVMFSFLLLLDRSSFSVGLSRPFLTST